MKKYFIFILIQVLFVEVTVGQVRMTNLLETGWKFYKGENTDAYQKDVDTSGWEEVVIPHDWAIAGPFIEGGDGNTGKLPWKGEGWYRRELNIPETYRGKRLYLVCDGIMAFPSIFINGTLAGNWDYGYNSFYLDITGFVEYNTNNSLAIHVDTRNHDSRWYPGAGIYRKMQLVAVNQVHIDIWGTYVTTPVIKPHYADVTIATTVNNFSDRDAQVSVSHVILTADDKEVGKNSISQTVTLDKKKLVESTITLTNPRRWDIIDPYMYKVRTEVRVGEEIVDVQETPFGIRDIRFTADDGFYLNDRRVQLKGVNLHSDFGPLGMAFNTRAMERQLEIMKDMGCNAVRTSHNTAAPELLDLCDRMGLLVFNEAFDKWDGKADITDTTDFENYAHRNIRNFVLRDRNHPSIFIWSVGNEMGDIQWNKDNGFHKLQTMVNYVRKFDDTRPVTMACDSYQGASMMHFRYYDIHSWNYGRRYALARQLEPNKAVIVSESASTVSTRGFYELPLPEEKTDFTASLQVSSYDLNAPEWAEIGDDDFMWQQEEPYIAGEFVWTGFDYLGEPTPYSNFFMRRMGLSDKEPSRSSYFGIVDLCGIPKDRYYLYKSYWNQDETTVHILPHWNWDDRKGQKVPVFIYTNGDCAELFLNGKSLGKKCKDPKSGKSVDRFRLMWHDVVYEPGVLKAVAYKEGTVIGENYMKSAGATTQLRLTPDRAKIHADGEDISYILVEALDLSGNPNPLAQNNLRVQVSGNGKLMGVGNGNPRSMNSFKSTSVDLFYGKAMIIVGGSAEQGKIDIRVTAEGLTGSQATITIE